MTVGRNSTPQSTVPVHFEWPKIKFVQYQGEMWTSVIVSGLMMSLSVVLGEDEDNNQPIYWPKQLADCHNKTLLNRMNFENWENEHYGHLREVMPKYQLCLLAAKRGCKDTIPEPLDVAIMLVIFLVLVACLLYFAFFKRELRPKMGIMSFFTERNECSRSVRTMHDDGSISEPIIRHNMPSTKWRKLDAPPGYKELKESAKPVATSKNTIPEEHLPTYAEAVLITMPPKA